MASFPYTTFTTSRGLVYKYIHVTPKKDLSTYLLFLHGFPSGSFDWDWQIQYFSRKGYGIIAPDCLGYGGSSKPLDVQMYKGKDLANDIIQILDHEGIEKVIGVGHDWGSFLLSRLANYHPGRFIKYVFIDVGYTMPGRQLDVSTIKQVNAAVQSTAGYSIFGYFLFFGEEDSVELLNNHSKSAQSLFHSTNMELGKKYMGAEGEFRKWLKEEKVAITPGYLGAEDVERQQEAFSVQNGGYGAAINWYRAQLQNVNAEDDKEISEEHQKLTHPTLLLSSTRNFITPVSQFGETMKYFMARGTKLREVKIKCGHWIMLEKSEETNRLLEEFFSED